MKQQSELFQDDLFEEVDTKRYGPSREELNALLTQYQARGGVITKLDEVREPRPHVSTFNAWRSHGKNTGYARRRGK